jgi:hypothetical protein
MLHRDNRYHTLFGAKRCFAVCPFEAAAVVEAALAGAVPLRKNAYKVQIAKALVKEEILRAAM